jgi:hypothetical protein
VGPAFVDLDAKGRDLTTNLCGRDVGSQAKHACCMRLVPGAPHEWAHEWNFPLIIFGCCLLGVWSMVV